MSYIHVGVNPEAWGVTTPIIWGGGSVLFAEEVVGGRGVVTKQWKRIVVLYCIICKEIRQENNFPH